MDTKTTKHNRYEVGEWKHDLIESWWAWVFVGGDLQVTEMVCREACFPKGLCVTVQPINYIFAGGTESGVKIGLIQYPPFPERHIDLKEKAVKIGEKVAEANFQWSFTIVTKDYTYFYSRRK